MPKSRLSRRVRVALGILGVLVLFVAAIGVKVRIGLGPAIETPPLVQAEAAPDVMVFHDVNVFTGLDASSRPHQDVLVTAGRVSWVKATGEPLPPGASVVEGAGRTLLPGYIDAHVHVSGSGAPPWAPKRVSDTHSLEAYVYAGVTTAFVLGGISQDLAKLEASMASGETVGPRLFYTHLMLTAPGGHPTVVGRELVPWPVSALLAGFIPQPKDAAEAEKAVAEIAEKKVHFIKVILDKLPPSAPEMKADVLAAIVEASHKRSLKVFAHIGTADDAMTAVRAGVDVLAHGVYRGELTKEQAEEIARRKVPVIFTLAGFSRTADLGHGALVPSALDEATVPKEILDSLRGDAGREFGKAGPTREFVSALLENEASWAANVRVLRDANVKLLVGTDSPLPGVFQGSAFHAELTLLSKAGVPNGELLLGATSLAAEVLGLDVGRIEAGKTADLVLVKGDPVADIAAAAAIEMVLVRGRVARRITPARSLAGE